jgi:L-iditol 2-dehydrogenase
MTRFLLRGRFAPDLIHKRPAEKKIYTFIAISQTMLQSFLTEPGAILFEHTAVPLPREGEVLIRMHMAGICGSDVKMFRNGHGLFSPLTIGHEGIGTIERVGPGVPGDRVGERVVIEPNIPCQNCPECWKGRGNICRNKRIIGVNETGCFAEYISIPGGFAHILPGTMKDADAVTIEPAAVALAALNRSAARPGDAIAVIGLGTIGMLVTHVALSLGYRVLISEPVDAKGEKAREMGAEIVTAAIPQGNTAGMLETAFEKADVTAVFECAGTGPSSTLAVEAAPRGAEVLLLGLTEEESKFRSFRLSRKGNRIVPSLIYDHPFDFIRCIRLVEKGLISPGIVVSGYFSLSELQTALEKAQTGKESKIVIRISGN